MFYLCPNFYRKRYIDGNEHDEQKTNILQFSDLVTFVGGLFISVKTIEILLRSYCNKCVSEYLACL